MKFGALSALFVFLATPVLAANVTCDDIRKNRAAIKSELDTKFKPMDEVALPGDSTYTGGILKAEEVGLTCLQKVEGYGVSGYEEYPLGDLLNGGTVIGAKGPLILVPKSEVPNLKKGGKSLPSSLRIYVADHAGKSTSWGKGYGLTLKDNKYIPNGTNFTYAPTCQGAARKVYDMWQALKFEAGKPSSEAQDKVVLSAKSRYEAAVSAMESAVFALPECTDKQTSSRIFLVEQNELLPTIEKKSGEAGSLSCAELSMLYDMATGQAACLNAMTNYQFNTTNMGPSVSVEFDIVIGRIMGVLASSIGALAMLVMMIGGFMMITAGGNEDMITRGKDAFTYGVIAILVVFSSYLIVTFVQSLFF